MMPFQIIPKGRDKAAMYFYKVSNWYLRQHRKEIEEKIKKGVIDYFLYGGKPENWES